MCKRLELKEVRLNSIKSSISLRLNAFFLSKNVVKCAKTRYSALKTRFMHIIGFLAMKALRIVQTHRIMQN